MRVHTVHGRFVFDDNNKNQACKVDKRGVKWSGSLFMKTGTNQFEEWVSRVRQLFDRRSRPSGNQHVQSQNRDIRKTEERTGLPVHEDED